MTDRKQVDAKDAPRANGHYSHAIINNGLVYCAGQTPVDPATGEIVTGGFENQVHQSLKNLAIVLKAAGSDPGLDAEDYRLSERHEQPSQDGCDLSRVFCSTTSGTLDHRGRTSSEGLAGRDRTCGSPSEGMIPLPLPHWAGALTARQRNSADHLSFGVLQRPRRALGGKGRAAECGRRSMPSTSLIDAPSSRITVGATSASVTGSATRVPGADAGPADHQRHAQRRVVDEDAVRVLAVLAERFAVIACGDDQRVARACPSAPRSRPISRSAVAISSS